jgi:hypothetical protein
MLQTVDKLRWRQYRFFNTPPSPTARFCLRSFPCRAYNRIIPLPLGLSVIQVNMGKM